MKFLAKELTKLGLSILEAEVYLGLLQRKLTTAGALSKHIGMKRSTVYTILDSLIEKGLVSTTQVESVKHYQAASPDRIADFLRKQKEDLAIKEGIFYELSGNLDELYQNKLTAPKVTIFEGKNGVNTLLTKNPDDKPKATIHIYDNSAAVFIYTGKDPVGTYIENGDITTTLKMIFEILEKGL